MFKIKISDGFCEWEYPLKISGVSINDIHTELCKAMGIGKQPGMLVSSCVDALFEGPAGE